MKQKLKEIAKYCCEPKSEAEFLAVKLAAEKGGVDFWKHSKYNKRMRFILLDDEDELCCFSLAGNSKQIPVHEYCELLMKDEKRFR